MSAESKRSFLVSRYVALLPLFVTLVLSLSVAQSTALIDREQGFIQDFAYHREIFREFFRSPTINFYAAETQLQILKGIVGRDDPSIAPMPIGWSPVAFFLFAPLTLDFLQVSGAYLLWMAFSGVVFAVGLFRCVRSCSPSSAVAVSLAATVTVLSEVWFRAVSLGQLSIFAVGVLLWLWGQRESAVGKFGRVELFWRVLALIALSLKPLYLLLGLPVAVRQFSLRALILVAALGVALNALPLLVMGPPATLSYIETLSMYSSGVIPPLYEKSIVWSSTATVNSVASIVGYDLRYGAALGFLLSVVILGILLLRWSIVNSIREFASSADMEPSRLLVLAVFASTVLTPYIGRYDDLLLFVPSIVLLSVKDTHTRSPIVVLVVLLALAGVCGWFPGMGVVLISKIAICLLLFGASIRGRGRGIPAVDAAVDNGR